MRLTSQNSATGVSFTNTKMFDINSSSITAFVLLLIAFASASSQDVQGIIYLDQPKNIDTEQYLQSWPALQACLSKVQAHDSLGAETCLQNLVTQGGKKDGAMNLLAQIQRRRGHLDEAWDLIETAIKLSPKEHLHYFQKALIAFEQRKETSFFLSQWKWHLRTKEAYEQALALEPRIVTYRYYVLYSYINTPCIVGGDKTKALTIAQEGVDLGIRECYLMRADAYLSLDKLPEAFADYDTSITLQIFKKNLESFKAAGYAALRKKDWTRGKRYFEYLVECRPDHPNSYDCLGDYYLAVGDTVNAVKAFKTALEKNPTFSTSAAKLRKLN
jgi:tetratricopeptide (TPR) repeat protein